MPVMNWKTKSECVWLFFIKDKQKFIEIIIF
jgi:hypothetical protein